MVQVATKKLPKSRMELTIVVPTDQMAAFFAAAYQELGAQVDIPGFRKGMAPKSIILERIGADRLAAHAADLALPKTYHAAVIQEELVPIAEPAVHVQQIADGQDFIYRVEVDVLPEVETGNYRKVRIDPKKYAAKPVDPTAIDEQLLRIRKAAAVPTVVERPAQVGDLVEMSYVGRVGGIIQDGLQSTNHPVILGEETILPDFEKQLIGMAAGEEKNLTVDVPKDATTRQPVEFTVKVEKVAELVLPELDETLARKFGKQTVAEVTEAIEQQLRDEAEREARLALETVALEAVVKQAKLELPEGLIDREVSHRLETLREQLQRAGQTLEQFLARQKKSLGDFRADLRPAAETAVKTGLVLRAIAENEQFVDSDGGTNDETLKKTIDFLVAEATK